MPAYNETSHAKNIAYFRQLNIDAASFGKQYNPAKVSIQLPQLKSQLEKVQVALENVNSANKLFNSKVNERIYLFDTLKPLVADIMNEFIVSDASHEKIKEARILQRKMYGGRLSDTKPKAVNINTPAPSSLRSYQFFYHKLLRYFTDFVAVIRSETSYKPKQSKLRVNALDAKLVECRNKNKAVANAYKNIKKARLHRDKILYTKNAGIIDTASVVKTYIKSTFSASSKEYTQIKNLQFKAVK